MSSKSKFVWTDESGSRLAKAVTGRRAARRWRQAEVADAGGLSAFTVSGIENPKDGRRPLASTLAGLDLGLQWPVGTARKVGAGYLGVSTAIGLRPEVRESTVKASDVGVGIITSTDGNVGPEVSRISAKSGLGKRTFCNVKMREESAAALRQFAELHDQTVSDAVQWLVADYLEEDTA